MEKILLFIICLMPNISIAQNMFKTGFESNNNTTAVYSEAIDFYNRLANEFDIVQVNAFGTTDSGHPLHEVIIDTDKSFAVSDKKVKLFINNAIHPGEPCGVDASMMLARDICINKELQNVLANTQLVILPFYNIGGGLNRNSHSRANQNGPEAYGFRGNAKNLDLNRDFIKCDSRNAKSFNQFFSKWNPHVMIDNHTSNGADYQYTMTLIATQKDKLPEELSSFMTESMLPVLYEDMKKKDWEMIPYVYSNGPPETGIYGFMDYPRYSSGYAALHHTISFMPETHMLKPYNDRVLSTYEFMLSMMGFLKDKGSELVKTKAAVIKEFKTSEQVAIDWTLDKEKREELLFKGYEAKYKPSAVSGKDRLYYDRSQPYEKKIDFFNSYQESKSVSCPDYYLIPQAYRKVIERLEWNGVEIEVLESDQSYASEVYYIEDYETVKFPYEGHYLHSKVVTRKEERTMHYYKGDYKIKTDQSAKNYIVSCLEPEAPDSYFAWNFFDGILMQKEHFSAYVFEDLAADLISQDKSLHEKLIHKQKVDKEFEENPGAQLNFIYEHSHHYEETHNRYPVARVFEK